MTRIAIIGTPRSGNTWIRHVLRDTLNLSEYAVHNYRDLPAFLEDRVVLQIHWPREPGFQEFLVKRDFKIIVPVRHPLDVLVSVLHFVRREPLTARWLEGNAEIPLDFEKETPSSLGFGQYAQSFGAENLLSVSYQWSFDAKATRARYETLVENPKKEFQTMIEALGYTSERLDLALEANSFNVFRNTPNKHGWQGTPGLWKRLIPWRTARHIRTRHQVIFDSLGYNVPFYTLSKRKAGVAWRSLAV
jgi:hypothetical protein